MKHILSIIFINGLFIMPSRQSRRRKSLSNDDSLYTRVAELENRFRDLSKTVYDLTVELAGLTKDMVDNGPTSIKSRSSRSSGI